MKLFTQLMICIFFVGITLFAIILKQNELTRLRLEIPVLDRNVKEIIEQNRRLEYEIEQFEQPAHLFELARKPEFSHLKHPINKDVILIPRGSDAP